MNPLVPPEGPDAGTAWRQLRVIAAEKLGLVSIDANAELEARDAKEALDAALWKAAELCARALNAALMACGWAPKLAKAWEFIAIAAAAIGYWAMADPIWALIPWAAIPWDAMP